MTSSLESLCGYLHHVQRERGLTAVCRAQGGWGDRLKRQQAKTDAAWQDLAADSGLKAYLPTLKATQPELAAMRALQAQGKADAASLISGYTRRVIAPILELLITLAPKIDQAHPGRVSAFTNLLEWKERVGQERATGAALIGKPDQGAAANMAPLLRIINDIRAYERLFLALSDDDLRLHFDQVRRQCPQYEEIAALEAAVVGGAGEEALAGMSSEKWFDLISVKMGLLQELVMYCAAMLGAAGGQRPFMEAAIAARIDQLSALPLFANLKDETLTALYAQARVVTYKRGAIIFSQGDPAERFYIVLDGWVKLLKGNAEGEESVFEVLTSGDSLSETVVFRDVPYPLTAQAVEKAALLSLPAALMRHWVQEDQNFALNMLQASAMRSQMLVTQFEQLTLKNVTQRVGRFLLKEMLKSEERSVKLELPFEKALIASYLGMKPETFSRTLQALKSRGINIDRKTVSLPDVFALCDFCDMELAGKCPRHGTEACPNPDCSSF